MKKYLSYIVLATALFFFASCSSDDNVEKTEINIKSVQGEWFCQENATYLKFFANSFQGAIYSNVEESPKEETSITGRWVYYPKNNILRMDVEYSNSIRTNTRDYKLVNVGNNMLVLFDMEFNTRYTFHKIVDNRTMLIGDSFKMSIEDFTPNLYSVVSPSIARVDDTGYVETKSAGTTFVRAKNESNEVYAKIDVLRIPSYQGDILSLIDKVYSRMGTPDFNAHYESEGISNMLCRYNTESSVPDVALNAMVYIYDDSSREITQIQIRYQDLEIFQEDVSYIKDNYYDVYRDGTVYGIDPGIKNNDFYIFPYLDDGIIIFANVSYYGKNGHY